MANLPHDAELTPSRYREFLSHDESALARCLSDSVVVTIAYSRDNEPVMLPTGYGFDDDFIYVHASTGSHFARELSDGRPLMLTVTNVDGFVYARTSFDSAVLYRSAVIRGQAEVCEGEAKLAGLRLITEHLLPGRWDELPAPTTKELAATLVLRIPLDRVSVKVLDMADGDSDDDAVNPGGERGFDRWAGVVPVSMVASDAVTAPLTQAGVPVAASVQVQRERWS